MDATIKVIGLVMMKMMKMMTLSMMMNVEEKEDEKGLSLLDKMKVRQREIFHSFQN